MSEQPPPAPEVAPPSPLPASAPAQIPQGLIVRRVTCACGYIFEFRSRAVAPTAPRKGWRGWKDRRKKPAPPSTFVCPFCSSSHLLDAGRYTFSVAVPDVIPPESLPTKTIQLIPSTPTSEALLRQYDVQIDLLKFYLELVAKVEAFYFAVAGTVASFVLLHNDASQLGAALWLPIFLGLAIAAIEGRAIPWVRIMNAELQRAARGLQLVTWPEARVLKHALIGAVCANLVVVGGLFWLFLHVPLKPRSDSPGVPVAAPTATPSVARPVAMPTRITTRTPTPTPTNHETPRPAKGSGPASK